MSETNVELVKRGFAAIAAGNLEAVGELLAPDVEWHAGDPDSNYACHNREEALAFMRARRTPRRIGQLLEVIDAGDRVVVAVQPRGEDDDEETPPPRAIVITVRDGHVAEMIGFESREAALASAGLGEG